mmetsp:Transcript_9137/g.25495  ORF Transcript_9137/g.25495 Transcript_9137/m.25495 type:complete len:247 (+) Transcript_9137:198-938(+)
MHAAKGLAYTYDHDRLITHDDNLPPSHGTHDERQAPKGVTEGVPCRKVQFNSMCLASSQGWRKILQEVKRDAAVVAQLPQFLVDRLVHGRNGNLFLLDQRDVQLRELPLQFKCVLRALGLFQIICLVPDPSSLCVVALLGQSGLHLAQVQDSLAEFVLDRGGVPQLLLSRLTFLRQALSQVDLLFPGPVFQLLQCLSRFLGQRSRFQEGYGLAPEATLHLVELFRWRSSTTGPLERRTARGDGRSW